MSKYAQPEIIRQGVLQMQSRIVADQEAHSLPLYDRGRVTRGWIYQEFINYTFEENQFYKRVQLFYIINEKNTVKKVY